VTGLAAYPPTATRGYRQPDRDRPTGAGYLYIGPVATNGPTTRRSTSHSATIGLTGSPWPWRGGTLSVTFVAAASAAATAHVIFDVTGYFTPDTSGASYFPLDPTRLLDTRNGTGLAGPFSSHAARTFQVTGIGGVPTTATAVTGNLTVTGQTGAGYLYVGPVATNDPTSSTLNFPLGDDRANGVTVALEWEAPLASPMSGPTPRPMLT